MKTHSLGMNKDTKWGSKMLVLSKVLFTISICRPLQLLNKLASKTNWIRKHLKANNMKTWLDNWSNSNKSTVMICKGPIWVKFNYKCMSMTLKNKWQPCRKCITCNWLSKEKCLLLNKTKISKWKEWTICNIIDNNWMTNKFYTKRLMSRTRLTWMPKEEFDIQFF